MKLVLTVSDSPTTGALSSAEVFNLACSGAVLSQTVKLFAADSFSEAAVQVDASGSKAI